MSGDFMTTLPFLWQFVKRPRWVMDFIADGAPRIFPNIELPGVGPMPAGDVGTLLEQTLVTWKDLRWMREAWQGPVIVKGVHTADDARCAMDEGADAIVVSNHGGRQLDGVPGSLQALPEVLEAVNGRIEVLMDGGIRRGADIAKALSLGARAVLIGRAYAWAVGAAGGPGVARAIEILKTDLVRTMRLLGCDAVRKLDSSYVDVPASWHHTSRGQSYSV
jgi:L-lactate dehydrogenase (cytochrome)